MTLSDQLLNRTTFFSLTLVMLFLLAGCGAFEQRGKNQPPITAAFAATGTEGIVMTFAPEQPPNIIFTGSPISILVEVRNRGTFTVPAAALYLSGFDPAIIQGLTNTYLFPQQIDAKSQFNPEGGYQTASFVSSPTQLPQSMITYKPNFLVTACYPYQTNANPLVCIDPRPQDKLSDKACTVQKAYATGGGQGAPVAVTNVESEATPSAMFFRIHLQNIQPLGVAYDIGALSQCPNQLDYTALNKINYQVTLAGGKVGSCQPPSPIRLANNIATIFCKFDGLSGAAYQTPLTIKLDYGYKNSISRMVEIQNTQTT
ncbi:hypothetical protein HY772_07310 [Candidatus Woesearchaeota archaeon]|nr:hypothetical protein [Candidatus Woesearchaeota archaeon]